MSSQASRRTSLAAIMVTGRAYALVALLDHEGAYRRAPRTLFDDDGAPLNPHLSYLALGDLVAAGGSGGTGPS